ncbi:SAM-dependent methyltransferase [Streptomyces chartreusis]|uniref:SAM-dependent methyltransferase n=1 Tax=Streptomyces chartreusis TaxID=1969 RepID=UPI002E19DC91
MRDDDSRQDRTEAALNHLYQAVGDEADRAADAGFDPARGLAHFRAWLSEQVEQESVDEPSALVQGASSARRHQGAALGSGELPDFVAPGSVLLRSERAASPQPQPLLEPRARDWAEIQERMFTPLYEAVYKRLEVGPGTRVLGLGCGSGLGLMMATSRGARVAGVEPRTEFQALALERLSVMGVGAELGLLGGQPDVEGALHAPYAVTTVFEPLHRPLPPGQLNRVVGQAAELTAPDGTVVVATWGPQERCGTASALLLAQRLAAPDMRDVLAPFHHNANKAIAEAGLRPVGGGRLPCPFGYADLDAAVCGLLSMELFHPALEHSGKNRVTEELAEILYPYTRRDGTVWLPNVMLYTLGEHIR